MRYLSTRFIIAKALIITLASLFSTAYGQSAEDIVRERRPFDYADKAYTSQGIDPELIAGRRNGLDKFSVFDSIDSDLHRSVRIIETLPGYDFEGKPVFWEFYGDLFTRSFTPDKAGEEALSNASRVPVFLFPSVTVKDSYRQAALIDDREYSAEKRLIAVGIAVFVEFTKKAASKEGREILNRYIERNGESLDGTPILKRASEIRELAHRGLLTQSARDLDDRSQPGYLVFSRFEDPTSGAISPDAFLSVVMDPAGQPLTAEKIFLETFDCLQKSGRYCDALQPASAAMPFKGRVR